LNSFRTYFFKKQASGGEVSGRTVSKIILSRAVSSKNPQFLVLERIISKNLQVVQFHSALS